MNLFQIFLPLTPEIHLWEPRALPRNWKATGLGDPTSPFLLRNAVTHSQSYRELISPQPWMLLQRAPPSPKHLQGELRAKISMPHGWVWNEPSLLLKFSPGDPRSNLYGHRAQLFIFRNKINPALPSSPTSYISQQHTLAPSLVISGL